MSLLTIKMVKNNWKRLISIFQEFSFRINKNFILEKRLVAQLSFYQS